MTIFICWFLAERLAEQDPTARLTFWVKITCPQLLHHVHRHEHSSSHLLLVCCWQKRFLSSCVRHLFFYLMLDICTFAIVLTCSKAGGLLYFLFQQTVTPRKQWGGSLPDTFEKSFYLLSQWHPPETVIDRMMVRAVPCATGPGRNHPLQRHWALQNSHLHEGEHIILPLLSSNVKPSESSLNQAAPD